MSSWNPLSATAVTGIAAPVMRLVYWEGTRADRFVTTKLL
jgi:hypothetical protein